LLLGSSISKHDAYLTTAEAEEILATQDLVLATPVDASQFLLGQPESKQRLIMTLTFTVSLSGVRPPHQLEAVYERILPQVRLRFLLADDPGAGKTIMAGLLFKELSWKCR